jgi:hypothetical protein
MENNRFYIYCHRKKTDGKCFYIGKGTGNRYKEKIMRNKHWHNVVNKHDFEPIILINNISEEKAFKYEAYFCKQIGYENLCNIRKELGNGGWSHSEETKIKMRKPKPLVFIEKMKKPRKVDFKKGIEHKSYGVKKGPRTHKHNISISITHLKPILQYDLEGNFIKEWEGIVEAEKYIKGDIGACCRDKQKTAGGYIFKYK